MAREFDESEYPEKRLTGEIIGAFYYVYHRLGYGFLESVYKKALLVELRYRGIPTAEEVPFEIPHRGVVIAVPRVDLLVDDRVIVETKAGTVLDPAGAAQLQNYLRASKIEIGLLLHFGPTPAVKRLIASRSRLRDYSSERLQKIEETRARSEGQ